MSDATPQELAAQATTKGVLNFADVLKGRAYPSEDVNVWLDEATAYPLIDNDEKLAAVKSRIKVLDDRAAINTLTTEDQAIYDGLDIERKELEVERLTISEALKDSRYVFTVRGISTGLAEDLLTQSVDQHPYEYDTYFNQITGQKVQTEKPSPERDRLYTNLLWQAHIVKITGPDGSEQLMPDLETVAALRREIPKAGVQVLAEAIDKVDMAVGWFTAIADETFLAKS